MIPATVSPMPGHIALHFYVPKDYEARKATGENLYPVVINFHGGELQSKDRKSDNC